MKTIKFAAAALAAIALASCTKPDGGQPVKDPSNVAIGITIPGANKTRAIGDKVTGGATTIATLETGHIFLYTASTGIIDKHIVLYTGTAPSIGTNQATFADVTNTTDNDIVIIEGVRADADKCMVVLNAQDATGADLITATMTDIKNVNALVLTAAAFNQDATINHVALFADGAITAVGGTTGGASGTQEYTRTAAMTAAAVGSRLQLGKVTAEVDNRGTAADTGDDITITAFDLEGVFVNYLFNQKTVGGTYAAAVEVDNGQTEANYGGASNNYASGQAGYRLADVATWAAASSPLAAAPPVSGENAQWWGYNFVPFATSGVPHLILKINNIEYTIGATAQTKITDPKWITVRAYYESGTAVTWFEANNIYTINNLNFKFTDLTELPETEASDVRVHVVITPWDEHFVTWKN